MRRPTTRSSFGAAVGCLLLAASAAPAQEGAGACRLRVVAPRLDPSRLSRDYPDGGERLAWRVRVTAVGDGDGLLAIGRAILAANGAQKVAIGEGLARAAAACDDRDGAVTTRIADFLRAAADGDVTRAFVQYLTRATAPEADPPRLAATPPTAPPLSGAIDDAGRYFAPALKPWP